MDKDASFLKLIEKQVLECKWTNISERWLNFIPSIDPPGSAPDASLSDVIDATGIASQMIDDHPLRIEIEGLREYVFREGVYLLHKASHVIGCAEVQARKGHKTWSLVEAYQGALFGAKAILCLCGLAFAEVDSKGIMIDVFPKEEDNQKRRKRKLILLDTKDVKLIKLRLKIEHRHVWMIFKRVLRVYAIAIWPEEYLRALLKLDIREFAKQRNEVNYRNEVWLFDDLHHLVVDQGFGFNPTSIEDSLSYERQSAFSLSLSLAMLRLGMMLFQSINELTNVLNHETQVIRESLTSAERHPLYIDAFA